MIIKTVGLFKHTRRVTNEISRSKICQTWLISYMADFCKIHVVILHTMTPYDICSITEDWSRKKLIRIVAKIAKTQEGVSW